MKTMVLHFLLSSDLTMWLALLLLLDPYCAVNVPSDDLDALVPLVGVGSQRRTLERDGAAMMVIAARVRV
jgi:hypothetical protein